MKCILMPSIKNDVRGTITWCREMKNIYEYDVIFSGEYKTARDLANVLDTYEEFILAELTMSKNISTKYIDAIKLTKTPWYIMLHGSYYRNFSHEEIFSLNTFTGKCLSTEPSFINLFEQQHGVKFKIVSINPNLPYKRKFEGSLNPKGKNLLCTSVTFGVKGIKAISLLADKVEMSVVLAGHSTQVPGIGSESGALLNTLVSKYGFETEYSLTNKAIDYSWIANSPKKNKVTFLGGYKPSELSKVLSLGKIHINLTSAVRTKGHLEYTTIEALDYGLPCIVPNVQYSNLTSIEGDLYYVDYTAPNKYDEDSIIKTIKEIK